MISSFLLPLLAASAHLVTASSKARNPLNALFVVESPAIDTPTHHITAVSHFDLSFTFLHGEQNIQLSLEPSNDVLAHNAQVSYLNSDGTVSHSEPIDRLEHKVYKGITRLEAEDGSWDTVGWARINVLQDGLNPVFEGVFFMHGDNHHIQTRSTFLRTKHELDPDIDETGDEEYMVMWRNSDIAQYLPGEHTELRRDAALDMACSSDKLSFNKEAHHKMRMERLTRDDSHWGAISTNALFGKRQIDSQPGAGNTGGVNLASTIGQTAGCPSARRVALVGVATDCSYTGSFSSREAVRQNVIGLMNSASHVWETSFNISLGLQNLTISAKNCPTTPAAATAWNADCSTNATIFEKLNTFSGWRGTLGDNNSHWTLLTACNFGSDVGLAWLGQACIQTAFTANSSGTTETVSGANVAALTGTEWEVIAHETGHTYGAVHDCIPETCSDGTFTAQQCCPLSSSTCDANGQYIMNPYTIQGVVHFSPCTIGEICSGIGRNSVNTSCLSDNTGVVTVSGSKCGNGIVEEGEECDCGSEDECAGDACCDPSTCKFTTGSECDDANELCCSSCRIASNSTVCRPSQGSCDPAEYCTGTSSTCPTDKVTPDGTSCTLAGVNDAGSLACAAGQCTSRDLQCQTVMGSYNHAGNNTFACDSYSCSLSCASPAFGEGVCYGLQQYFLDGTPCVNGGMCSNGQCQGGSFGKAASLWINDHKGIVIGVATGVGCLLLLLLACCLWRCCSRRSRQPRAPKTSPNASWYNPSMPSGVGNTAAYQPSPYGYVPPYPGAPQNAAAAPRSLGAGAVGPAAPVSPLSPTLQPIQTGQQLNADPGAASRLSAYSGAYSPHSPAATSSPNTPVDQRPQMWGRQPSMRYA